MALRIRQREVRRGLGRTVGRSPGPQPPGFPVFAKRSCTTTANTPDSYTKKFQPQNLFWWSDVQASRSFFRWLADDLSTKAGTAPPASDSSVADFLGQTITRAQIANNGGAKLLARHGDVFGALKFAFPEHFQAVPPIPSSLAPVLSTTAQDPQSAFESTPVHKVYYPWMLNNVKVGPVFWKAAPNRRAFLVWLYAHLRFSRPDNFYSISTKTLLDNHGRSLLRFHQDSIAKVVMDNFPSYTWHQWRFVTPQSWWESKVHQRTYFDWLAKQINVTNLEDWYSVSHLTIKQQEGGHGFLRCVGSLRQALLRHFPAHPWQAARFAHQTPATDLNPSDIASLISEAESEFGIKELADWYKVPASKFRRLMGSRLLNKGHDSLATILTVVYPNHLWEFWRFPSVPMHFWRDITNARQFLDHLSAELGFKDNLAGWYDVQYRTLKEKHSGTHFPPFLGHYRLTLRPLVGKLLEQHKHSLIALLKAAYPQHTWEAWRFSRASTEHWRQVASSRKNADEFIRKLVKKFEEDLGVETIEDWYRVSKHDIRSAPGHSRLSRFGGLINVLRRAYPDYPWDLQRLKSPTKKSVQRLTFDRLRSSLEEPDKVGIVYQWKGEVPASEKAQNSVG